MKCILTAGLRVEKKMFTVILIMEAKRTKILSFLGFFKFLKSRYFARFEAATETV